MSQQEARGGHQSYGEAVNVSERLSDRGAGLDPESRPVPERLALPQPPCLLPPTELSHPGTVPHVHMHGDTREATQRTQPPDRLTKHPS